ncbi:MAG: hypothetical protein LBQ12_10570 [Deltaproteobacteria bacterium]|jgi:hypothetical protein|nr:hypothetical protein [Deltaproteobacteria bacterium]
MRKFVHKRDLFNSQVTGGKIVCPLRMERNLEETEMNNAMCNSVEQYVDETGQVVLMYPDASPMQEYIMSNLPKADFGLPEEDGLDDAFGSFVWKVTNEKGIFYIVSEAMDNWQRRFHLIGPGNNWCPQVLPFTKLGAINSHAQNDTHLFCIDYFQHRTVMIRKSDWAEVAWHDFTPTEGYQAFGVKARMVGNWVKSLYIETIQLGTSACHLSCKAFDHDLNGRSGTDLPAVPVHCGVEDAIIFLGGKSAANIVYARSGGDERSYAPDTVRERKKNAGCGTGMRFGGIKGVEGPVTWRATASFVNNAFGGKE